MLPPPPLPDLRPNFSLRPHFLSQCINSLKENRRELMFPFLPLEQKPTDKSVWNFASWAGSLAAFRPRLRLPLSRRPAEPRSPTPFTHSPPPLPTQLFLYRPLSCSLGRESPSSPLGTKQVTLCSRPQSWFYKDPHPFPQPGNPLLPFPEANAVPTWP